MSQKTNNYNKQLLEMKSQLLKQLINCKGISNKHLIIHFNGKHTE